MIIFIILNVFNHLIKLITQLSMVSMDWDYDNYFEL